MVIVGVLLLDSAVDYERLRGDARGALPALTTASACGRCEDATGGTGGRKRRASTSTRHLRRARLPRQGRRRRRSSASSAGSLPRPSTRADRGGSSTSSTATTAASALVVRIHHSYADGIALIGVMLSLTDADARRAGERARQAGGRRAPRRARTPACSAQLFEPLAGMLRASALRLSGEVAEKDLEPCSATRTRSCDYARIAASVAAEVAQLATMPDDSRTRFKGTAGGREARRLDRPACRSTR